MSRTPVETTPPATAEDSLQPAQDYSRLAEVTPFRSVRTSVYVPRERRLWTAALAAALLITAGGLGILYVGDTNYQNADRALTLQNEELTGKSQNLQTALATTQGKLTASQHQVTDLTPELAHPTLGIWNVPQAISGSRFYPPAGVQDTLPYHHKLAANCPMPVRLFAIHP